MKENITIYVSEKKKTPTVDLSVLEGSLRKDALVIIDSLCETAKKMLLESLETSIKSMQR